jgi:hypothetical protein
MLLRPLKVSVFSALLLTAGLHTTHAVAQTPAKGDESADDEEEEEAKPAAKPEPAPKASVAPSTPAPAKPEEPVETAAPPAAAPADPPLTITGGGWKASLYGFAELDILGDSTQSFGEGSTNATLARPNTVAGDNPRVQLSARNSRFGFRIGAPKWNSIRASAVVEMDFFGEQAAGARQNELYTSGPMRMRHFYAKLETPIIDALAGQYHDLFAWGGAGFYPNTAAYLPVLGEIYHRNPQLRLSKTVSSSAVDFEIAAAVVRPVQRDAGAPDGQAGIRLAINGWKGASVPGASRPVAAPMELGVSGVVRHLSVTDFSVTPGNPKTKNCGAVAINAFVPIIPAKPDDLGNALSVSGEFTVGSGISDLYSGLSGGVGFPALPNPNQALAVPTYLPNIDPGIATYDASGVLHTVSWRGIVVNAHYHLPIADGKRLWLSGTYSTVKSSNAVELTPIQGRSLVWDKGTYFDGALWWAVTPAAQVGLSFQHTEQTFGDGVVAKNNRGQAAFYLFF